MDAHWQKEASTLAILPQSSHTPTHLIYLSEVLPYHNPPQKPNPFLHRPKLQTVLTQKMKMKKMPLKTVKMTSWMPKTRRMMKRRLKEEEEMREEHKRNKWYGGTVKQIRNRQRPFKRPQPLYHPQGGLIVMF